MGINIYLAIVASLAASIAATAHDFLGYPDITYTPSLSAYTPDLFSGAGLHSSFDLTAPQLYSSPLDFYSGHAHHHIIASHPHSQLSGFAYHNDLLKQGSANVVFLTGPGTSQLAGFPNYFYPGLESPAVEIARKKASNAVDAIAAGKKVDTKTKTKELCDTLQDALGKNGVQHFYSLDNGPVFIRNGFDFNAIPTWPFGFDSFGATLPNGKADPKVKIPKDKAGAADDDTVGVDRKITISVPKGGSKNGAGASDDAGNVINPSVSDDAPINVGDDADKTISPLAPSTDAPETTAASAGDTTVGAPADDARKKKRQSVRVRAVKKL